MTSSTRNLNVIRIANTETGTMDLEFKVEEGQKSYIERIDIRGNTKTKDKVIRRELAVSPGEVFDMVRVKGREQAVRIYELIGHTGAPLVSEHEKALWCYADALEAYRKGRWAEALGLFRQALTLWPQDGPSRALAARCEVFQATPPPDPWDGVFEQLTK